MICGPAMVCGPAEVGKHQLAKALEEELFNGGRYVYYLGLANSLFGTDSDIDNSDERDEYLRRLGETSHLFTDAGLILITTVSDLDDYELDMINKLNQPNDCLIVNVGPNHFSNAEIDLQLDFLNDIDEAVSKIKKLLSEKKYFIEYYL